MSLGSRKSFTQIHEDIAQNRLGPTLLDQLGGRFDPLLVGDDGGIRANACADRIGDDVGNVIRGPGSVISAATLSRHAGLVARLADVHADDQVEPRCGPWNSTCAIGTLSPRRATVLCVDPERIFEEVRAAFVDRVQIIIDVSPLLMGEAGGHYDKKKNGMARVRIRRSLVGWERVATLVHELGHYESETRGRPAEYERAVAAPRMRDHWRDRPVDERRAVLNEEALAWCFGLRIARDCGLDDDSVLVRCARAGFENYRGRLALPADEFNQALATIA